ncbi:MAG: VOC family protein [Salinigranum sp.]
MSILAEDIEESAAFYCDLFDMERVPTPNFEVPVQWLQAGDLQLHLFERDMDAVPYYHFGILVDDFEEVYRRAKEEDLFTSWDDMPNSSIYLVPDGAVQMYISDPAGNLVEVNYPSIDDLDTEIIDKVVDRRDLEDQSGEAAVATLNLKPLS